MAQRQDYNKNKTRNFDVDKEYKKVLTAVSRETEKLLIESGKTPMLDVKAHEALVAYTKLIGGIKKQMDEALKDMNAEDVEKLAVED